MTDAGQNFRIQPLDQALAPQLQAKIAHKTKPLGSLGRLETLALQIGLIQQSLTPALNKPQILVFAADHGLAESGVSAYPASVTAQMVSNFLAGGAAINVFARQHGLGLTIVDAGVNAELPAHPVLVAAKIGYGTASSLQQPAMTAAQCRLAIVSGAELVQACHAAGSNCLGFGEMGIGNTSAAALLLQRLTGWPLVDCVGRGTGLDDIQLAHKRDVLQQVLDVHSEAGQTPLEILATLGGFELAMMTGAYLQAAELGMVIMVDGFIASTALLVAARLYPAVLEYCVFSHVSDEHAHRALLNLFNAAPILDLAMRLGEGSGVAVAFPVLQSALLFLNEMATFSEAGVDR